MFFGNDPDWPATMHRQKLMLHRASLQAYTAELEAAGHVVKTIEVPAGASIDSADLLNAKLQDDLTAIHLADPEDDVLMKRIRRIAEKRGLETIVHPSPNFLSPPGFIATHVASKKKPFMAAFCEAQGKRTGILLEPDGTATGGKWPFDTENRSKLQKNHVPPREPVCRANDFTREAAAYVGEKFPDNPGSVSHFRWPVTRADAERWLDQFIGERFENFGLYEDAISTDHATLYHAAITPALNIGQLDPQDVIDRVMKRADSVPMNSLEGFIRQVIGWRVFMRGIYQHHGTKICNGNFWGFETPLPQAFYDATAGIPPVDRVIRKLLEEGWCHHIERLMVLGNFMLLSRIVPDDVYHWFMEMFVDSYDWVMVPDVYGMSQFADGGTFATKPYLSGSNHVLKMSDEPRGDWCRIWDGLVWTFIADYQPFFLKNPRLSMMARSWEKVSAEKQAAHRKAADGFHSTLR